MESKIHWSTVLIGLLLLATGGAVLSPPLLTRPGPLVAEESVGMLDRDVEVIASLGVRIQYDTRVGRDIAMNELRRDNDAVLLAVGGCSGSGSSGEADSAAGGQAFLHALGAKPGDPYNEDFLRELLEAEVLSRRDVAEHRAAVPADQRRADGAGDVVVARRHVGDDGPQHVKRRAVAQALFQHHVAGDFVQRHVARPFDHHLDVLLPSLFSQFPQSD